MIRYALLLRGVNACLAAHFLCELGEGLVDGASNDHLERLPLLVP